MRPLMAQTGDGEFSFPKSIAPIVQEFCLKCHNSDKREADFRVDGLKSLAANPQDIQRWEKILEMVSIGDMPPEGAKPLGKDQRDRLTSYIAAEFRRLGRTPVGAHHELPSFGNRVDHDALFSGDHKGPAWTPARVWRVNSHIYSQLMEDLELRDFVPPLNANSGEGFDDYANLYADEATIRTMIQNGKRVAMTMVHGRFVKVRGAAERDPTKKSGRKASRHRALAEFAQIDGTPSRAQMDDVVRYTFQKLLQREPSEDELTRYVTEVLTPNITAGGSDEGLRGFIVSVLLSPEFLFRMEMGRGKPLPDGRRMLSPHELAFALSFALHDHPVPTVMEAARDGKLETREDFEREVRKMLASDKLFRGSVPAARRQGAPWQVGKLTTTNAAKPRLLRFFREYFDYPKAVNLFKDDIRHGGVHVPKSIVEDADWFVLSILATDRNVLEQLLTSDNYYVAYKRSKYIQYMDVYNLTRETRSADGPSQLPEGQRAGMLTHPAWLVAHSGNFETDPVRRGKWIQEHLLGGVVPDLPIGVEAQLPEEPHHTIRERFRVVREAACWRCHKKMNPLGEQFEAYDDFGRFRDKHHVTTEGHVVASVLEVGRKRRYESAEPKHPVDTSGHLAGTGDRELDGDIASPIQLVQRLAKSSRVRQVFLRHVFRFWMGRNETLDDSPTLMAMDRAYVESKGSFNETLVALLTSDSFLYRK